MIFSGLTTHWRRPGTTVELGKCAPRFACDGGDLLSWMASDGEIPGASPLGFASGCFAKLEAVRRITASSARMYSHTEIIMRFQ